MTAVEIRAGGAVAVDTETLRRAADRYDSAGDALRTVADRVGALQNTLLMEREYTGDAAASVGAVYTRLHGGGDAAAGIAARLREAAAVYELVELNAAHLAAVLAGDVEQARAIAARRDALMVDHPDAMTAARRAESERAVMWPAHLVRQATETGHDVGGVFGPQVGVVGGVALGGGVLTAAAVAGLGGFGRIPAGARLSGATPEVAVRRLTASGSTPAAPAGLAAAAARIPGDSDARVRVEKYAMPDGSRRFAVYVAGTRSIAVGGPEPFDSRSNVELYTGRRAASYEATAQALRAAGARPGDVVHAFGHSQGAMVASHLALEGGYDTRTVVTYGSPVEADVGADTLAVGIRHTDDPVAALAGGGHVDPVGAPGSFIAEREAHPPSGPAELSMPAHGIAEYTVTAELVDAASDPRVAAVAAEFAELDTAVEVEVFEFATERVDVAEPVDRTTRRRGATSPAGAG